MRALRKIVFVNSAHIRYAEVRLDGNVHFIGTQGVGKSTLLRAILFFYNADKLHLGIPKEMKSFDEFYLPHANSYIVYEVEHEHGPFSILVFRYSGRACYRFVDAAFSKDWLVDEHGEVTADVKVIRGRLNGASMSKIIDRYEQYRDIIYGNHVSKEFARFQLMETNVYQNIPRSIQNVFLNSRLDANFIKDIIIRSMREEEASLDLGYFRRQVSDFETEYRDISCWYRVNAKGESVVRKQADAVVKAYHDLLYMKKQVNELCGCLNYAVREAREQLPLIETSVQDLSEQKQRQERLLGEVVQKFDQEKASLNREQGAVDDALKRLKERREFYVSRDIDAVLRRCEKEEQLAQELDALKLKHAELTSRFNDVTAKFKALVQAEKSQFDNFMHSQNVRLQKQANDKLAADERLMKEFYRKKDEIASAFSDSLSVANSLIDGIKSEKVDCEKALYELKFYEPFRNEIKDVKRLLSDFELKEKELVGLIGSCGADISRFQAEFAKDEAAVMSEYDSLASAKQREVDVVKGKIADIDALLERTKGSLFEWLEENKPNWEQNIGKVINEEQVLYQTGLHPQVVDGDSFFGVQLNLVDLPQRVRKPKELLAQKQVFEKQLAGLEAQYLSLMQERDSKLESLKKPFLVKLKEARQTKSQYEAELAVIPQKRKALNVAIGDFETKGAKLIAERREELSCRQQEIAHRLADAEAELKKVMVSRDRQLKLAERVYNDERVNLATEHNSRVAEIQKENSVRRESSDAEIMRLKQLELEELKGRGADTSMVEKCSSQIRAVESELSYIRQSQKLVFDYLRDKEELFDNEDKFRSQKKLLSDKLLNLSAKYELKRANYVRLIDGYAEQLRLRYEQKRAIEEDMRRYESFVADVNLCPVGLADVKEQKTIEFPGKIISDLTGVILARQRSLDKLKENVNVFKGNFSAKNTFSFPFALTLDDDYFDFASNLDDFLINNKLEEYRRRTSERYVNILARVSKEMGDLTRHESNVERIINDINNDFRERNFVGVIKLIALKSVPSSDKMVQLMKTIKDFNDENSYMMGELNLFSTSNRDEVNSNAVDYLLQFMKALGEDVQRQYLTLSDLFQLQFRIVENDNDTGWADKLSHVGSEGTDTLVKAMINIMLINVFKEKVSRRFGDFRLHCMMDEIGKLHPQNIKGILDFANARNILLINSSPTTYNVSNYRYTYLLSKDGRSQTVVHSLISQP